jgi:hypothetical protein
MKLSTLLAVSAVAMFASPAIPRASAGQPDTRECKPLPKDQRALKVNFKPDSYLLDVVSFYAKVACKRVDVEGDVSQHKVTIAQQPPISREELAQLVRSAAAKVGVKYDEDDFRILLRSP